MKALAGIRLPSYVRMYRLARKLTVLDQETSTYKPFVFNLEQRFLLRALLKHKRVRTGKARQIGSTTIHALVITAAMLCNPGLPCGVVADSWDNSEGVVEKIAHWVRDDLGITPTTDNVREVKLANGARCVARTALQPGGGTTGEEGGQKESKTGRSKTFGIVLATERSFWRNARAVWAAMTSALSSNARVWDESTGAPGDGAFRESLDVKPDAEYDGWHRIFFSVESHENYRIAEEALTDEQWAERFGNTKRLVDDARWEDMRNRLGFQSRAAAAWWRAKLIGDFQGDEPRMRREFPVRVEDMFVFAEGQHIRAWKEVAVVVDGAWNFYRAAKRTVELDENDVEVEYDGFGEPVVMAVDVAHGLGGKADASAIVLIGQKTRRVCASFRDNTISIPELEKLMDQVVKTYRPVCVIVESNGPGAGVYAHAALHYMHPVEQVSSEGELWERRDSLRWAIERKDLPIGGHLAEEAKSSNIVKRVSPTDGTIKPAFAGKDDVLSAVSFALRWIDNNPFVEAPVEEFDREVYRVKQRLEAKRAKDVTHY